MKYRKKPVVIEAFQMTKERRWDNSEWPNWLNRAWQANPGEGGVWIDSDYYPERERLVCGTLEGVHRIEWGDWIIQGVKGEIIPCKPDIFKQTYELVEEVPKELELRKVKSQWLDALKNGTIAAEKVLPDCPAMKKCLDKGISWY